MYNLNAKIQLRTCTYVVLIRHTKHRLKSRKLKDKMGVRNEWEGGKDTLKLIAHDNTDKQHSYALAL